MSASVGYQLVDIMGVSRGRPYRTITVAELHAMLFEGMWGPLRVEVVAVTADGAVIEKEDA